jgi:trk system potassium uptake protein TrkH
VQGTFQSKRAFKRNMAEYFRKMNPAMLIVYSYIIVDLLGTLLLSLPVAMRGSGIPVLDSFFTATSALCVTGLTTVDVGTTFTFFGQTVIMALMEIGGLGVMTFSVVFFLFLGRGFSSRGRWIITESFAAAPHRHMKGLLKLIFLFTLSIQIVGALLLFVQWRGAMPFAEAVFAGVFHAVSAFCNAGICLFPTSFVSWRGSMLLNATICSLIVIGGIGFPVIYELFTRVRSLRAGKRTMLSLHTRIVLTMTFILTVAGALLVFLLERNHQMASLGVGEQVLASVFQSITARTAGFNTLDIGSLTLATLFILIILMFVGASPGSCGGGIKTTSLAVLVAILNDRIRGRHSASLFKRTIPNETVSKSLSIFILAVIVLTAGLIVLLVTQPALVREDFLAYLFEAVSAFGTVGLSMGVTSSLNVIGKITIIAIMLLGRVGLLTVAYVVTSRRIVDSYRYAPEKVMIG